MRYSDRFVILTLLGACSIAGCKSASDKAVDSTKFADYITRADSVPQPIQKMAQADMELRAAALAALDQASEGGDPNLKAILALVKLLLSRQDEYFAVAPGKDFEGTEYFSQAQGGGVRRVVKSSRSAVDNAALAGIAGIDASKFIEAGKEREFALEVTKYIVGEVKGAVGMYLAYQQQQRANDTPAGQSENGKILDDLKKHLADVIKSELPILIRAELDRRLPATAPAGNGTSLVVPQEPARVATHRAADPVLEAINRLPEAPYERLWGGE